jgi:hypothetical protein
VEDERRRWLDQHPLGAPSEQGKPTQFAAGLAEDTPAFHFKRPPSTVTVSDTHHIISADIQEDCESYEPTRGSHIRLKLLRFNVEIL